MSSWAECLTTGIPIKNGAIPIRKDLNDFSDKEMFLYIEGLRRFQSRPADDPLSYYQIAGIHGLPFTNWPDKSWNKDIKQVYDSKTGAFGGFCTHSSVLFLTWHRPYLSLYEAVADSIDSKNPDKAEYQQLAQDFRIPYWDWARKGVSPFPIAAVRSAPYPNNADLFKDKEFKGPPLSDQPKHNPLFTCPFPNDSLEEIKMIRWYDKNDKEVANREYQSTVRYPAQEGPDNSAAVVKKMSTFYNDQFSAIDRKTGKPKWDLSSLPREMERNLSERVAYILRGYQRFGPMSYNAAPNNSQVLDKVEIWGSLEDIHNSVHGLIGGGGHMAEVEKSAFDPIFWLHHAPFMKMRISLIHMCLKTIIPESSFAKASTVYEDENTPLWPFRRTVSTSPQNDWWTSKQVKRTETFGYVYPELQGWDHSATGATLAGNRIQLTRDINKYYSNLPDFISQSKNHIETAGEILLPQAALVKIIEDTKVTANIAEMRRIDQELPPTKVLLTKSLDKGKPFLRDLAPNNTYLEWLVNIRAEKHALGGDLQVHVFLGAVEEDNVALWPYSPHHVGSFVTLGQKGDTACANCQQDQADHKEVTGQIPLTLALAERYLAQMINDLSEASVIPYLQKNLHWRAAIRNGGAIADRSIVPGLKVAVTSNEVTVSNNPDVPPIYAPTVTIYAQITTKKDSTEGRGEGTGITEADQRV